MDEKPTGSPDPNSSTPVSSNQPAEAAGPVVVGQTTNEVNTTGSVTTETAATGPTTTEPVKAEPKKKTGLIVGIIVGVLVLIGACVGVAFALMNMNKMDPVTGALNKLMNEGASLNVVANGEIDLDISGSNPLPISGAKLNFNSEVLAGSVVNSSTANLELTMTNDDTLSIDIDEMYVSSGDLYLKIGGVKEILLNYILSFNAGSDLEDLPPEYSTAIDMVAQKLEGKWLRVSSEQIEKYINNADEQGGFACLTDMIGGTSSNRNTIADIYNKNPFIVSTNEKIAIAKKQNPIYKINVDSEKFVAFANSLSDSGLVQTFYECVGLENNEVKINEDKIREMVSKIPDLYVEIDDDYFITRLYFESQITEDANANTMEEGLKLDGDQFEVESSTSEIVVDCADGYSDCDSIKPVTYNVKADLLFSYPTTLNINEPTEYEDFYTVFNNLFNSI